MWETIATIRDRFGASAASGVERGTRKQFLQSGVVFLIAAVFAMVPLAKRLQLGAVLGYLLAGVLIGPSVLGLVDNPKASRRSPRWAWYCCCSSSAWSCRRGACG